jgi:DNA-binding transcriptional MerR regulator
MAETPDSNARNLNGVRFWTTRDLAEMLRCRPETIRTYARRAEIPHVRMFGKYLFEPSRTLRWLERRKEGE